MRLKFLVPLFLMLAAPCLRAGTATGITGLYFTGVNNTGALLSTTAGTRDSHWTVTYASTNGGASSAGSTYTGSSYVVSPLDGGWTANSSNAQWVTAPGARTSAGGGASTANRGGDYLPGNGNTGGNEGVYIYVLQFMIAGSIGDTIGSTVTNNLAISLTISADDQFKIFLNPANKGAGIPTEAAQFSGTTAWNNTTPFTLANFNSSSTTANSTFKIGTNYLVIEVDNTNSIIGSSDSTARNPSGLLFYQTGSQWTTIGNRNFTIIGGTTVPIPETGVLMPVAGALAALCFVRFRRRSA